MIRPAGLRRFRRLESNARPRFFYGLVHTEPRSIEIKVTPTQSQDLTPTHSSTEGDQDRQEQIGAAGDIERCFDSFFWNGFNLSLHRPGGFDGVNGIRSSNLPKDRLFHCLPKQSMNVQNRSNAEATLRTLSPMVQNPRIEVRDLQGL